MHLKWTEIHGYALKWRVESEYLVHIAFWNLEKKLHTTSGPDLKLKRRHVRWTARQKLFQNPCFAVLWMYQFCLTMKGPFRAKMAWPFSSIWHLGLPLVSLDEEEHSFGILHPADSLFFVYCVVECCCHIFQSMLVEAGRLVQVSFSFFNSS